MVRATVSHGLGWASKYLRTDIAMLSVIEGNAFVAGSLNLVSRMPVWLDVDAAFYRGERWAYWHANLNKSPVVLGRWLGGCPAHVFEIFSWLRLRETFALKDGDTVSLELPEDALFSSDSHSRDILIWNLFWRFRERQFYHHGAYRRLMLSRMLQRYTWRSMQRGTASDAGVTSDAKTPDGLP